MDNGAFGCAESNCTEQDRYRPKGDMGVNEFGHDVRSLFNCMSLLEARQPIFDMIMRVRGRFDYVVRACRRGHSSLAGSAQIADLLDMPVGDTNVGGDD